jgi:dolichol kinase
MKLALLELSSILASTVYSQTHSLQLTLVALVSLYINLYGKLPQSKSLSVGLVLYEIYRYEFGRTLHFLDLAGATLRSKVYSDLMKPLFPHSPYESAFLAVLSSAGFELGFSGALPQSTSMGLSFLHSLSSAYLLQPMIQHNGLTLLLSLGWDCYRSLRHPLAVLFWLFDSECLLIVPYWVVVSAASLLGIHLISQHLKWSQIIVRKLFHFMLLALLLPAANTDFTVFASLLAVKLLIICEILRGVNSLKFVTQFYARFIDQRDLATFARTHLYLLLGNFMPLALGNRDPSFKHLGMLSLGVGDSVASIIGSKYGKSHWPGSRKTLEGSGASLLSQLGVAGALGMLNWKTAVALSVGTAYEAYTEQIDNLTLPLVCCSVYELCSMLWK